VFTVFLVYSSSFALAFDYFEHVYIICGITVPAFILRMYMGLTLQLDSPRQLSALTAIVAFRVLLRL
jgi:hypothetical protein